MIFDIDPDITRAETLSSEFYTDEKYFRASKEKIFARTWQLIGSANATNNLAPFTILENFLDEPVLVVKTDDKYNCLSNVCTHRGKILIETPCRASGIRCAYHGRRFDLSGKFLSMPEFEGAKNFPGENDDLRRIPFEVWREFFFASVNPIAPLGQFIAEMQNISQDLDLEGLRFSSAQDYQVKAHWALYCENYLEGFHVPFVHKGLNEAIDYGSYQTETFRFSSLQTALSEPPAIAGGLSFGGTTFDSNKNIAALYFYIFPNLMLNFYPWGLSVNIVKPLTPDLTRISYLTFISDESKLNRGAGADLETVEFEDHAVVESVQKGINSRFYDRGRYSPSREQGTHHFHRLIAEFMNL